jgi:HlyD family secretion protein
MRQHRWWKWILGGAAVALLMAYGLRPEPIAVDTDKVAVGPLRVTVVEEGKVRVEDRYIISSPVTGHRLRLPVEAGDLVVAEETLLARIEPLAPIPLDARARGEAQARLAQANAGVQRAQAEAEGARTVHAQALRHRERTEALFAARAVPEEEADDARLAEEAAAAALQSAQFAVQVARFEQRQAEATLATRDAPGQPKFLEIRSPVAGQVLRLFCEESAAAVVTGEPLLEVGDPQQLEVEVDVLSSDGVRIPPGAPVILENWGGDVPLEGRVRRVDPGAFTEVSALGVDEQRVTVWIDLVDAPKDGHRLGDGYRVDVGIVLAEREAVLRIPEGALFQAPETEGWAVFVVDQDRARRRTVQIGLRNGLEAEVLEGLDAGEVVVVFPGDTLRDGARVVPL